MTIDTYIAMLHDGPVADQSGEPVLCPLQPDGNPKPTLDHHGIIYQLVSEAAEGEIFDYRRIDTP
jgi:hypothetical protein